MMEAMQYIQEEGPKFGYFLQHKKGAYLLGKCPSRRIALERKLALVTDFGLDADAIFIHPDNGGDDRLYGAKVLGSYCGSDAFILSSLESKLAKIEKQAGRILDKVHSKQLQFLLLRWCFSQKVTFWQRTIPPKYMNHAFVKEFDSLKKKILSAILNVDTVDFKTWSLACQNISQGGLGLQHTDHISHSAYLASLIECSRNVEEFLRIPDLSESDIPMISEMRNSLDFLNQVADSEDKLSFQGLKAWKKKKSESLQHMISNFTSESMSKHIESLFNTPEEVAWITSLKDPDAGTWLEIAPKTMAHTMQNTEFEMALALRLHLPQKCIVKNVRCSCSTSRKVVKPDVFGIHFCTGCNKDGVRIQSHDRVRDQLDRILRYCDILTVREERNVFRGEDPDNGKRPDISALNLPGKTVKYLLDIRLTSPIPAINPESLTLAQAKIPLRAANKAYAEKKKKFDEDANNSNLGFLPVIFEITGKMHPEVRTLLQDIITQKARQNSAPFAAIWKYWISSLMMTLQKKLAEGILERCFNVYGSRFRETHESTRKSIIEIGQVRV